MAIMMIGEADNLTPQNYAYMITALQDAMQAAPGFVMHTAHPREDGGMRVVEIWRSKEESDQFFAKHVAPNLPPGIRPKRKTLLLESLVTAGALRSPQ